jgi:hypothetical protein
MSKLTTQASIGIGVPLGVILIFTLGGIIWANVRARRGAKRGDVELVDPNMPAPKVIKWNPHAV